MKSVQLEVQQETFSAAEILRHWQEKTESLETCSLKGWSETLQQESFSRASGGRLYKTVSERFATLEEQGLLTVPCCNTTIENFLKNPERALKKFSHDTVLYAFIQAKPYSTSYPSIKGQKVSREQLISLAAHMQQEYPQTTFMITVLPLYHVQYQANVLVNSDRSVIVEVGARHSSPSRGDALLFTARSPAFFDKPVISTSADPAHLEILHTILRAIPRVPCDQGTAKEYLPGYYEVAVGRHPDTRALRALFYDYRPGKDFTL